VLKKSQVSYNAIKRNTTLDSFEEDIESDENPDLSPAS